MDAGVLTARLRQGFLNYPIQKPEGTSHKTGGERKGTRRGSGLSLEQLLPAIYVSYDET